MNNVLEYKGYYTRVEYSAEDGVLFGKIEGINDLVTFEEDNLQNVQKAFQEAVDDYLIFCEDIGQEPDKVYKGNFNVRISPELHRELALVAFKNDESLNQCVEKAIREYVHPESQAITHVCESIEQVKIVLSEMGNWTNLSSVGRDYGKNRVLFKRCFNYANS